MYADLHLHSNYSDGDDSPDELIKLAKGSGLSVMAITDHDTVEGYLNISPGRAEGIRVIPAIEISTILQHSYLHVLGYYIDACSQVLSEYIQWVSAEKTENTRINFENAVRQGCFDYRWERVLEHNPTQTRLSGVHVVAAMQGDGYSVPGMGLWDMFHRYFRAESPDFIPTETATAQDAIDVIKAVGGIPAIAHPKSIGDDGIVLELIEYGVQGLEVFHPIHSLAEVQKYQQIAKQHGLYITGGTDWHGGNNGSNIAHFGMCALKDSGYAILSARG